MVNEGIPEHDRKLTLFFSTLFLDTGPEKKCRSSVTGLQMKPWEATHWTKDWNVE